MSAQGQDYSSWQDTMNLTGLSFVIIRATLGNGGTTTTGPGALTAGIDVKFAPFWKQAAGIHRGAYHFFYPGEDPVIQADLFVRTVKAQGLRPGDLLFCDSETAAGNVDSATKAFCDRVRSQVPSSNPVGVYANHDIGQHLVNTAAAYPDMYWFAYPSSTAPGASLIAPWKAWRFWQWGQRGVDQDAYNGTAADLDAWISGFTGGNVATLDSADLTAVAHAVWGDKFTDYSGEDGTGPVTRTCSDVLYRTHTDAVQLKKSVTALAGQVTALQAAVTALAAPDEAALAAALGPVLTPVIQAAVTAAEQAGTQLDAQQVAAAVVTALAGKLSA